MAFSTGNQAAMKAAQDIIKRGQALGDQSVVDAGMQAQGKILAEEGVAYQPGSGAGAASGGITYAQAANGGTVGTDKGDALERELKSLYGSGGTYAAALAAQQRAQQANVNKAVSTLQGQKQATNRSYAELFRQLYKEKMDAQKNIDQRMAAQGVTGGASESTLLGLETGYAEALRQGEQGRLSTVNEIDRAIADARLDGDIANAQLAAESARAQTAEYASVLQGLLNRYDNQQATKEANARTDAATKENNARQLALAIAQSGEMPTDELLASAGLSRADVESIVGAVESDRGKEDEATTYKRALEKAENLAKYGDFSGYAALGYTAEEIAAMKSVYDAAVAAERAGKQTPWKPKLTAAQTLDALEKGVVNDETLAAYKYWYGQDWKSKRSQTVIHEMTQDEIDDVFGADSGYSSGGSIGIVGGTSAYNRKTSVGYDANNDTITWNGKTYTDSDALTEDIMAAGLTEAELKELKKNFAVYGFTLE